MSRSLRRGLLTAAAVWAVSAAAGSEWDRNHDDDRKWLASTVVVTSTVLVDLKDVDLKCQRGEIVCGPTPPPFPDSKPCLECAKGHEEQGQNEDEHNDPEDVYHGLWEGCSHDDHCPHGCNCSPKAICETLSEGPQCKSSTGCEPGHMCNSNGYCQPLPGPRCQEKACEIDDGSNCNDNKDCSHGEVCNQHGFCQKVVFPDCQNNWDCKHGQVCTYRGICKTIDEPQCTRDSDCGDGQLCNSQRICEDVVCPKCQLENECEHEEACHDGFCKPKENKCQDIQDCKNGEICDWEGKCRRGEHNGCKDDSECKWGQICDIHGRCQHRPVGPVCGSDRDCDSGEFCNAFGYCEKEPSEHGWKKPSEHGEKGSDEKGSSEHGWKKPGEHGDKESGEKESGDKESGEHGWKKPGEHGDKESGDKESGEHGWKDPGEHGGKGSGEHGGKGSGEHGWKDPGEHGGTGERACQFDSDCGLGGICNDNHQCEERRTCLLNSDCLGTELCEAGECLTRCLGQADCEDNETCDGGVCLRRRFCLSAAQCLTGEICQNNYCELSSTVACLFDFQCGIGNICNNYQCEARRTCLLNTDCLVGTEVCRAGECLTTCVAQTDCEDNETCDGGVCLRKRYCTSATQCQTGELCQDNYCETQCGLECIGGTCQAGSICSDGFSWAHYKLARSTDDTTTTPGTIPIHPADLVSAETWPVLQFSPNVAVQGQVPDFTGLTTTLGIQERCPPELGNVYGTETDPLDYTIVQHIGYFVPQVAGTYTLTAAAATLDQSLYVWFGADAQAGYTNTNADLVADANWLTGSNIDLYVVAAADVGTYIPMRILWVNAQDCGQFDLTITGPGGATLVSRGQATADGQFVTNCAISPDIPLIAF
ncbi:proteinase inhibitor [Trichoderma novae-zelandiae]